MSGFKVGDSSLGQSLWLDGVLDAGLGWEAEDRGFGNDCLTVLRTAREFFQGDAVLFALWEHDGQVTVMDDHGRTWCTPKGSEIEHGLSALLDLAGRDCPSASPETVLFKHLLGDRERVKSCLFKQVPAEDGKQGLFLVVSKQSNFFAPREYQLLGVFAANLGFARRNRLLATRVERMSQAFAALEDIGTAIARTNDFEEVLGLVLEKLEHLTGATGGGVLLYDGEKQELVLQRPAFGAQNEDTALYRLSVREDRPSEGLAVEVFLRRRPYICNDASADKKSNQQYIRLFGIRNFVTIPLVMENRGIGVLHLVNKRQGYFNEQDVQLLGILASELAVLIENARLINQTKRQHDRLSRSVSIHKEFTQMVLEGKGLKSIAGTLAQLVGCQVVVTDQFFRLIATGSAGQEAGLPEEVLYLPEHAELEANDEVRGFFAGLVREKVPGRLSWGKLVAPVVVGTDVLGYVFIQETGKVLEEMDIMAVEHASTVIALEMMQEKIKSETINRLKGDCLDDLLAGNYKSEQEILDRANYLGYDLSKPFQVLVVDVDNFSDFVAKQQGDEGVVSRVKQRLFEVINNVVNDASPHSIATGKSDSLVILAHEGSRGNTAKSNGSKGKNTGNKDGNTGNKDGNIGSKDGNAGSKGRNTGRGTGGRMLNPVELAREIKNKVSLVFAEITVSIGVGRVAYRLQDIRESHREARTCLNMIKKFGHRDRLVTFEQLGIYRLLHQVEDVQELAGFARQVLGPVAAYDARFGTMLVNTLRCYVENNFNLQKTAKNSYLHINTLNYRLKRIQEIGRLDLNEPEQRLNVQVALKIMDVLPEGIG